MAGAPTSGRSAGRDLPARAPPATGEDCARPSARPLADEETKQVYSASAVRERERESRTRYKLAREEKVWIRTLGRRRERARALGQSLRCDAKLIEPHEDYACQWRSAQRGPVRAADRKSHATISARARAPVQSHRRPLSKRICANPSRCPATGAALAAAAAVRSKDVASSALSPLPPPPPTQQPPTPTQSCD